MSGARLELIALDGIGEIQPGDDLPAIIHEAAAATGNGEIFVSLKLCQDYRWIERMAAYVKGLPQRVDAPGTPDDDEFPY